MLRALSLLAVAACVAAPALAAQQATVTRETTTIVSIPAAEYQRWQQAGFSTQDIFYAYNTAAASNRRVDDIFAMRKAGQTWEQIAAATGASTRQIYGIPSGMVAGERMEVSRGPGSIVAGERIEVNRARGGRAMRGEVVAGERVEVGRARDGAMPGDMRPGTTGRYTPAGVIGGISPYGVHERPLPHRFYRNAYRLTPREYRRLRAAGFSQDEVYMIANAANETGLDPQHFMDAIYRGQYARGISIQYGISPERLTRIQPEWRTPEWAAVTGDPPITKERLDVIY